MITEKRWLPLKINLEQLYREWGIENCFKEDEAYLKNAFMFTESLWYDQYRSFDKICFVLLAEAPLYGREKSYFYNKTTRLTSFFYYEDIKPNVRKFLSQTEKKADLLSYLKERGIIILDMFPYALNPIDTKQLTYKKLLKDQSKYLALLSSSYEQYLKPKLQKIRIKASRNLIFAYRYETRQRIIGDYMDEKLKSLGLLPANKCLESIGSQTIDRDKFNREIKKACESL